MKRPELPLLLALAVLSAGCGCLLITPGTDYVDYGGGYFSDPDYGVYQGDMGYQSYSSAGTAAAPAQPAEQAQAQAQTQVQTQSQTQSQTQVSNTSVVVNIQQPAAAVPVAPAPATPVAPAPVAPVPSTVPATPAVVPPPPKPAPLAAPSPAQMAEQYYLAGLQAEQAGDCSAALKFHWTAMGWDKKWNGAQVNYAIGRCHARMGDCPQANAAFIAALKIDSFRGDPGIYRQLAGCQLAMGQYRQAQDVCSGALQIHRNDPELLDLARRASAMREAVENPPRQPAPATPAAVQPAPPTSQGEQPAATGAVNPAGKIKGWAKDKKNQGLKVGWDKKAQHKGTDVEGRETATSPGQEKKAGEAKGQGEEKGAGETKGQGKGNEEAKGQDEGKAAGDDKGAKEAKGNDESGGKGAAKQANGEVAAPSSQDSAPDVKDSGKGNSGNSGNDDEQGDSGQGKAKGKNK